jgi:hypothetical protein
MSTSKRTKNRGKRKSDSRNSSNANSVSSQRDSLSNRTEKEASDEASLSDRLPTRRASTPERRRDSIGIRPRAESEPRSLTRKPTTQTATTSAAISAQVDRSPLNDQNADPLVTPENVEIVAPPKPRIDLNKLTNPSVRREAAKLAAQVDKFQLGLNLAQTGGYKIFTGMDVEAELQKVFEVANANGDAKMLRQLTDATSFKGKLSLFQPTTEAGRSLVRITQLFNATRGDGTHAAVQNNIANLASDATTLRQMARDVNLLQGLDNAQYVDPNRLLRTVGGTPAQQISATTREWHIEQASLMKAYREAIGNDALQKKLALTMLQSFAKAAPLGAAKAEELGAQVSPLLNQPGFYHRSAAENPLLITVLNAYCQDMGVPMGHAHLVDNTTFREVLAREYVLEGVDTQIGSILEYERAIQNLFQQAETGNFPEHSVVLDITQLFNLANLSPKEMAGIRDSLERTFLDEAEKFLNTHPAVDQDKFADLTRKLQIAAMTRHKGVDVLLTPPFLFRTLELSKGLLGASPLKDKLLRAASTLPTDVVIDPERTPNTHMWFFNAIEHSMIHSGYRLDPIQARKAWLEVVDPSIILGKYNIQMTELATADKPTPKVFASFNDFTNHATFQRFAALGSTLNNDALQKKLALTMLKAAPLGAAKAEELGAQVSPLLNQAPPYLKTLPQAIAKLLRGLTNYNKDTGGVDKAMQDQRLDEVLQTSYFRMLNAMASALQNQNDLVSFMNQVEVIQQQIATLVSLLEPYDADAFGDGIRAQLTDPAGPNGEPVIPSGLDSPGVQLKPSAMHCLASILSSVEALKQSNDLNVCVVKDHYYESAGAVTNSGTYSVSQFDGDAVRSPDGVRATPLDPTSIQGKKPLDLYVCDFHHNISLDRSHYQLENLQHHVDELYRTNLVADKFTVAIDCTIDFVNSKNVQAFLEHNKDRIQAGELNVALFRSAQKFDMFGMDNYYGGFVVNINDHIAFADFNTRMEAPEDQLKGPSRQGLSHIAVNAAPNTDEYRNALMASTKRFYDALPSGLIWSEDSTSVMQVAKTDDPNAVFLDIKFPDNAEASEAFMDRLKQFASEEGLPLTGRASFGFATTNLNLIHGEKTRLTPGLEGPEVQDRYIAFFEATYKTANKALQDGNQQGLTGTALHNFVAKQIKKLSV